MLSKKIAELIEHIHRSGELDEQAIRDIEADVRSLESDTVKNHLLSVLQALRRGDLDSRSILGKSIRLKVEELKLVKASLDGFLSEEPFREGEMSELLEFWSGVLEQVIEMRSAHQTGEGS